MSQRKRDKAKRESASVLMPSRGWDASRLLPLIVVIAMALLAMGRLCGHDFTNWDDGETVVNNPNFNPPTLRGVMSYWLEPFMDLYVPVTYMVWGVVAVIADRGTQLDPHVFHAANVLIHTGNAAIVFLLLRQLVGDDRRWAVAAGAALFAVHPVQVETVGWVSGMKDLLCGTFTLIALWAYVAFARLSVVSLSIEEDSIRLRRRWWYYGVGITAFVLAMLSKPTAVVTPVMAAVLDWMILKRPARAVAQSLAPWFVLTIPCVIWTKKFQSAEHVADVVPPVYLRTLVATDALAFYLGKLVYPGSLAIDYGRKPSVAIAKGWVYWTWVVPATLGVAMWLLRRRLPVTTFAGLAVAVLGLLPVLGLVRFDFQAYSTVADHYLYLPMAGIALVVAAILSAWPAKRWALAVSLILVGLTVRSVVQAGNWADSLSLFRHALAVTPESAAMHNSLAATLVARGETDEAVKVARRAVELDPGQSRSYVTLASALAASGQVVEAERTFRDAIALAKDEGDVKGFALGQLAGVVAQQGRINEAISLAQQALELSPHDVSARFNLGVMLVQQGRKAEAVVEFEWATRLSRNPTAETYLGLVLADLGRFDEARRHFEAALRLDPNFQRAHQGMAQLNAVQGRR